MVLVRPVIDAPEAVAAALAAATDAVEVTIGPSVPGWLDAVVAAAHREGVAVVACLVPDDGWPPARRSGWEIGAATAAFAAGVDEVIGPDPRRVAWVRAVVARVVAPPEER